MLLILFLSIGHIAMASTSVANDVVENFPGEIQKDHSLVDQASLRRGNIFNLSVAYEIPVVNQFNRDFKNFLYRIRPGYYLAFRHPIVKMDAEQPVSVSLDTFTIIYPFHTFF
ncbi:hypothetical protein SAMN04487911_1325 [Arenibacter nanhaiticus]|uniref:Uncharacterized protein n=1 Tax=Arenibacter nanhaiticus TaxID=558155 RepID=A0A1M6LJS8_9FLAO|nr:hypothetical protein [Arenibacter nanhaiticus]SHJ71410.1 hypothetical protein SAMN04487911_1325 [Arenibacter nanhaiticus]